MLHTFAVLGGDARQHYLAELLTASGFTVHTFAVPELPNTAASLEESVSQADAVCLPTPAVTSGAIRRPFVSKYILIPPCFDAFTRVFGYEKVLQAKYLKHSTRSAE